MKGLEQLQVATSIAVFFILLFCIVVIAYVWRAARVTSNILSGVSEFVTSADNIESVINEIDVKQYVDRVKEYIQKVRAQLNQSK